MFLMVFLWLPLLCFTDYYSQCGQDRIIYENYFWNCKSGVFVDIGAHNGITFSNSCFFEKELGWTGICVEPIPEVFAQLEANRKCTCIQGCITNHSGTQKFLRVLSPATHVEMLSGLVEKYDPIHYKRMNLELSQSGGSLQSIDVKCYLLNDVLKQNRITHVNLLSIDTEGGEFEILSSIDFSKCQVDVITVEDNYNDPRFIPFLKEKGFKFVRHIEQDLLFVNKDFKPQVNTSKPRISIITSVYNGDAFVEGFLKDITQQTIFNQCELIMINANSPGHEEPIIKEYMTKYPNIIYVNLPQDPGVYGVWNQAIKMASADLVTNANLDDRSHPQALEKQVEEMEVHPDIDLVYAGYLVTHVPNDTYAGNHAKEQVDPPEFSIKNIRYCLPGPRPVWRKSMHERYGFFDETFLSSGDAEMWVRAVSLGSKFKKVPGFYTLYYFNPEGLSTDADEKKTARRVLEGKRITETYGYLFELTPGSDQEGSFLKLYNLGLRQRMENNLDGALESFSKAYALRPTRAEPLLQSAVIYREKGNILLGYLLAKYALSHPYPDGDAGVDSAAYDHAMLIEFTNCALLLGKFKEGFDACSKLLANPNLPSEYKHPVQANYELALGKMEVTTPALPCQNNTIYSE